MARTKTLQSQLRDVALDYMKQVAKLLNRDPRDCHWVGTDDHERGIYTICDFGDITFTEAGTFSTFAFLRQSIHVLGRL